MPGGHSAVGIVRLPLPCRLADSRTAPETGSVLQLKVRFLGISPMIWRRVLVPETMSLHELHGVLQVAMGWEAIHLIQFSLRGVVHAGPHLHGQPVDIPLSDLRFRRNAKFRYVCDMRCWREHELTSSTRSATNSDTRVPVSSKAHAAPCARACLRLLRSGDAPRCQRGTELSPAQDRAGRVGRWHFGSSRRVRECS